MNMLGSHKSKQFQLNALPKKYEDFGAEYPRPGGDSKTFRKANFDDDLKEKAETIMKKTENKQQEVNVKNLKGFGAEFSLAGDWPMQVQEFYAENEANFMDKEFTKVDKINEI